ncbi:MAG: translocation/assembly module TamB domain-containing protein [Sideroxydans sp.]|nr:translocation/assembly module TamB domain-containing protein [Sideroxydans sp.]
MSKSKTKFKLSRRGKWLLWLVTPCVMLGAGGTWLVATTSGLQWLTGLAERNSGGKISMSGVGGSLLDSIDIQQLVFRGAGTRITLRGLHLQWRPSSLLHGQLNVLHLTLQQADVLSPPSDTPAVLPDNILLPLDVRVQQMHIAALRLYSRENAAADFAAGDIEARLDSNAQIHDVQVTHIKLDYGDLSGALQLSTQKPFKLQAAATLDAPLHLSGKVQTMRVTAAASGDLQHIKLSLSGKGAGMNAQGSAQLSPVAEVLIDEMQFAIGGVQAKWLSADLPPARLSGSVELRGKKGGVLEGAVRVRNGNAASYDKNGLPVVGITARLRITDSQWQFQQLDALFPQDGHITGKLAWQKQSGKIGAQLKVRELDPQALDTRMPSTRIQGDISLESAGQNQRVVLALSDSNYVVSGELNKRGKQVELRDLRVVHGETVLSGKGHLALNRRRTFSLVSRLQKLNLAEFMRAPATDLNASLEVSGTLSPEAAGVLQFDLFNSRFADYEIGGSGHLDFVGLRRAVGEIEARLGDNSLRLDVAHGTEADHLKLLLDAPNLAQVSTSLGGKLSGQGDLSGTLDAPALNFELNGTALLFAGQHIDQLDAAGELSDQAMNLQIGLIGYHAAGEAFTLAGTRAANADCSLEQNQSLPPCRGKVRMGVEELSNVEVSTPTLPLPLQGGGDVPASEITGLNIPQAKFDFHGSRAQHTVNVSARLAQGARVMSDVSLVASGGFSDAAQGWQALQWQGTLDKLDAGGIAPLHLLSSAPLALAKNSVQFGAAELAMSGGKIQIADVRWAPQRWHTAGKFSGLGVRAVNAQSNKQVLDALDTMRFGGAWDFAADGHWQGNLQVQRESGSWVVDNATGMRLGLRKLQIALRAKNDRLEASLDAEGDRLGELSAQAGVPLTKRGDGWTVLPESRVDGHLHLLSDDLSWLGPMLDANWQSGGKLKLDADLEGTVQSPQLDGEAHGDGLLFALLDQGVRLEQGQMDMRFDRDVVTLDKFSFSAPYQEMPGDSLLSGYKLEGKAGRLSASGSINLQGEKGDLQIAAERMPFAQRPDRWLIASGSGSAHYANDVLTLESKVRADAGLIKQLASNRPSLPDDVHIVGQEAAKSSGLAYAVDAMLDFGEHFYIRTAGLEARLSGQINLHSKPGETLQATGIIAAQDALFDAYGQRLQVDRGMVNFQGPPDDPGLNILALRKGLAVEAGVQVTGTLRRPVVQLVSTPSVPDAEKLSWIMLGRVPDATGVDSTLLLAAAGNILGGQSAGQIGRAIGVDELSLRQKEGSAGADAFQNQVVTVGKRLNSRAYLSYEQGLSDVGGITKFTYNLTSRLTVVTKTGTEDALDLVYSFRFY